MGSSEVADHYRNGLRAGFEQIAENFGTAFLPMRASNRETHLYFAVPPPRRTPAAMPAQDSKKRGAEGHENYNIGGGVRNPSLSHGTMHGNPGPWHNGNPEPTDLCGSR